MNLKSRRLPLVSVILPAYNAARYIQQALSSVLTQTYRNLEVLVVDDGSVDDTAAIVRQVSAGDPRVKLFRQANAGVAAARNLALQEAHGDFIAPIDADDIWFPFKIERQVDCITSAEDTVGLVYTWVAVIDRNDRIVESSTHRFEGKVLVDLTIANFIGCSSTPLIRRSCLEAVGGYNAGFKKQDAQGSEDWDLYLRISERYEFKVVPEFLVGYRQTPDSMSWQYVSMERSHALIMNRLRLRHPEFPRRVFHWSLGNYSFYLLGRSYDKGHYSASLRFLFQSVRRDPLRLLLLSVYWVFFKCLLRLAARPLIPLIWKDQDSWARFWNRVRYSVWKEYSLEELASQAGKTRRRRLFRILHARRMARVKEEIARTKPHRRNHADIMDSVILERLDQPLP